MISYSKHLDDTLYIDIGNTAVKWQYSDTNNKQLESKQTIGRSLIVSFLCQQLPNISNQAIILIACVAHQDLLTKIKGYYPNHLIKIAKTQKTHKNLINAYADVSQLGVDRWLNLIAIYEQYPKQNILLLSLGTASTLDALSADGQHQGGLIMPSAELIKQSLPQFVQKTTSNNQALILTKQLANNTKSAWQYGCDSLWLSGILALINQYKTGVSSIILTGGYVNLLSPHLNNNHIKHTIEDNLVLTGLSLYLWDNQT